jgi:hypothetical protein
MINADLATDCLASGQRVRRGLIQSLSLDLLACDAPQVLLAACDRRCIPDFDTAHQVRDHSCGQGLSGCDSRIQPSAQ